MLDSYARTRLEMSRRAARITKHKEKARHHYAIVLYSRRTGGDLMGGFAGVLSPTRRLFARDRRFALAGATVFVEGLLVTAGTSLRRSPNLGAGMYAWHRRDF